MSLRNTFKTNKALENNGVSVIVGINEHNNQPIKITLARMTRTNPAYAKALEEASRPHTSAIQNETLDEKVATAMMKGVFIDTILLGWENLPKSELTGNSDDTDDLPFTRENALALFEELPDMYLDWEKRAKQASTFRGSELEKAAKN